MALTYRTELTPADRPLIREMVSGTGFFDQIEIDCSVELVDDRLKDGPASGYSFVFAEEDGRMIGYACYGPIPLTFGSYDLYWIIVDKSLQGRGLGRQILVKVLELIREEGGRQLYIETSTREQYLPTRAFYERFGCPLVANLDDFYSPGDGKVIYCQKVP